MVNAVQNSFSFIAPEHPFHADVARFKTQFESSAQLAGVARKMSGLGEPQVRKVIRGHYHADAGWEFRGLSLSFQWWTQARGQWWTGLPAGDFRAVTLFYSTKTGGLRCYEFPQDPWLPLIASHGCGNETQVLRYIPRRRFTFRTEGPDGVEMIGKCVRAGEISEFRGRLAKVHQAASRGASAFSVPAAMHEDAGAYYQQSVAGSPLTASLNEDNFPALLRTAGMVHRDLHRLPVEDAATWDFEGFLRDVRLSIRWIAFFKPEHAAFLEKTGELLWRWMPRLDPREYMFCHGDFSCSQILRQDDCWSIVDFDQCLRADPYWEIAKLMAFLPYDLSLFRESHRLGQAHAAYLDGYQQRAETVLHRKRLLWYRVCFEICYLARLFKRDRLETASFDRAVAAVQHLADHFRNQSEESF